MHQPRATSSCTSQTEMRAAVKGTNVRGSQDAFRSQPLLLSGFHSRTAGQIQAEDEQEQVTHQGTSWWSRTFFSKWFCSLELFHVTNPGHFRVKSPLFSRCLCQPQPCAMAIASRAPGLAARRRERKSPSGGPKNLAAGSCSAVCIS